MAIGNAETVVAGDNNIAIGAGSRVGVDEDAWKRDYTMQKSAAPVANGIAMGVKAQATTIGGVALGETVWLTGKWVSQGMIRPREKLPSIRPLSGNP